MNLLELGGFRTHLLLPHDLVGSIIDDAPTFHGLEVQAANGTDLYLRHDKSVMRVEHQRGDGRIKVTVTALAPIWVQEMGLTAKVQGDGTWGGIGRYGQWTSPPYTVRQKDAHKSTIHFSRVRTSRNFTVAVQYAEGGKRWTFRSGPGFSRLLGEPPQDVPWHGCDVFGRGWQLKGVIEDPAEVLRRWELAGHPEADWMHFHGWSGGAGAVVQGVPPYRADQILHPNVPIDHLWNAPRGWRKLEAGRSVSQTLTMEER